MPLLLYSIRRISEIKISTLRLNYFPNKRAVHSWISIISITLFTWSRNTFEYTIQTASIAVNVIVLKIHNDMRLCFSCKKENNKKSHIRYSLVQGYSKMEEGAGRFSFEPIPKIILVSRASTSKYYSNITTQNAYRNVLQFTRVFSYVRW